MRLRQSPQPAEPLYLTKYIERMGTGTGDMIRRCQEAGLPEPEFSLPDGFVIIVRRKPDRAFASVGGPSTGQVAGEVAGEVTGEVAKLLLVCHGAATRRVLREALQLKADDNFRRLYLVPALAAGLISMTIPDKPNSRLQKYQLTAKGRAWLAATPRSIR